MTFNPGGGGSISGSSDVALSNAADGQTLTYDGSLGKWTNKLAADGATDVLGSINNPVTDSTAPRPTGLTYVVWNTAVDPAHWQVGDFNLQQGS